MVAVTNVPTNLSVPQPHLPALTGIRFLAAAMIVEGHSWALWQPSFLLGLKLNQGVSIFFVLSGFILACAYSDIQSVRQKGFFLKRFARIWPLHILSTAVLLALVPSVAQQFFSTGGLLTAIHYVTLTQTLFPTWQNVLAYNGVAWTIATEAFFYASFPLWILDWRRLNWLKLPTAIFPVLLVIQYVNQADLPVAEWSAGMTPMGLIYFFPVSRLPEFVFGVVLGSVWVRGRYQWSPLPSTLICAVTFYLVYLSLRNVWAIAHDSTTVLLLGSGGSIWLLENGFTPVFGLLIFVLASSTGPFAWILGSRVCVLLGEISFSTYLFHTIILRYFQSFPNLIDADPLAWRILYWCGLLAISYLAFEMFEKPVRGLITGKGKYIDKIHTTRCRWKVVVLAITMLVLCLIAPHLSFR